MSKKARWAAILVAVCLFVGALIALTEPSNASESVGDDGPGCVSAREFNSVYANQSRAEVEKRWEVQGLGVDFYDGFFGHFIVYPMCGYVGKMFPRFRWRGVKYMNHESRILYCIWDH